MAPLFGRHGRPRRNSLRRPCFDYRSPGAYFVTICTWQRAEVFGQVVNRRVHLNALGRAVRDCWRAIPVHFDRVTLGEMVVMPDHIHGIVFVGDRPAARAGPGVGSLCRRPGDSAPRSGDSATGPGRGSRGAGSGVRPHPRSGDPAPVPASRSVGATHASPLPVWDFAPARDHPPPCGCSVPSLPSPWFTRSTFPASRDPSPHRSPSPARRVALRRRRGGRGPAAGSLGAVIGALKAASARRVNLARGTPGAPMATRLPRPHHS
jgi:hypothetical protein